MAAAPAEYRVGKRSFRDQKKKKKKRKTDISAIKILKIWRPLELCFSQPRKESDQGEESPQHQRALRVLQRGCPAALSRVQPPRKRQAGPARFEQSRGFLSSRLGARSSPGAPTRGGTGNTSRGVGAQVGMLKRRQTVPAMGKDLRTRVKKNFRKCRGGWRSLVGKRGESPGERRRRYFPPKCYLLPLPAKVTSNTGG